MKRWMPAVLAVAIVCAVTAPVSHAQEDAEAKYQALLTAAKANPEAADWQALRFAYADRPSFSPFPDHKSRRMVSGEWRHAIRDRPLAIRPFARMMSGCC
jgi:hypothetical protein